MDEADEHQFSIAAANEPGESARPLAGAAHAADLLRRAGHVALDASNALYETVREVAEGGDLPRETSRAIEQIQESARELRRHALWLLAEAGGPLPPARAADSDRSA
jgi:hypothetical protein